MKILISGWYGHQNVGDEVILSAIINRFREIYPFAEFIGLSSDPVYTSAQLNVHCIQQIPVGKREILASILNLSIFTVINNLLTCDLFILGGGGFLSDWQPEAPKDWLRKIKLVKLLNSKVKVHVFGIGAGPFITDDGKAYVKKMLERYADEITVRDLRSYHELKNICKITSNVNVEIDPVAKYFKYNECPSIEYDVCLIVKDHFNNQYWSNSNISEKRDLLIDAYKNIISLIESKSLKLLIISFHSSKEGELLSELSKNLHCNTKIIKSNNVENILLLLKKSNKIISMRLHGNILAYALGKSFLPIVYHFKTYEFLKMINFNFTTNNVLYCGDGINWENISPNPEGWKDAVNRFLEP